MHILTAVLVVLLLVLLGLCSGWLDAYLLQYQSGCLPVAFVGGVHGNESASCAILDSLYNSEFTVIPRANRLAVAVHARQTLSGDLNRQFESKSGKPNTPLAKKITQILQNTRLVVDFHEGWGVHRYNPDSLGSTITPNHSDLVPLVDWLVAHLPDHWQSNPVATSYRIPGTLSRWCGANNKYHILVETTGQNSAQPLHIRQLEINTIVNCIKQLVKHNCLHPETRSTPVHEAADQ